MKLIFIDTNIFIYAAGDSHPRKTPSLRMLEQIASGRIKALTSAEVLQEILYRYAAIKDAERVNRDSDLFSIYFKKSVCKSNRAMLL